MSVSSRLHRQFKRHAFGIAGDQPIPCFWCNTPLRFALATVEHIVARGLGGTNVPANLVLACRPCNSHKAELEAILAAERRRQRIMESIRDRRAHGKMVDRLERRLRFYHRFLRRRRHRLPEAQANYEFCARVLAARGGAVSPD